MEEEPFFPDPMTPITVDTSGSFGYESITDGSVGSGSGRDDSDDDSVERKSRYYAGLIHDCFDEAKSMLEHYPVAAGCLAGIDPREYQGMQGLHNMYQEIYDAVLETQHAFAICGLQHLWAFRSLEIMLCDSRLDAALKVLTEEKEFGYYSAALNLFDDFAARMEDDQEVLDIIQEVRESADWNLPTSVLLKLLADASALARELDSENEKLHEEVKEKDAVNSVLVAENSVLLGQKEEKDGKIAKLKRRIRKQKAKTIASKSKNTKLEAEKAELEAEKNALNVDLLEQREELLGLYRRLDGRERPAQSS